MFSYSILCSSGSSLSNVFALRDEWFSAEINLLCLVSEKPFEIYNNMETIYFFRKFSSLHLYDQPIKRLSNVSKIIKPSSLAY